MRKRFLAGCLLLLLPGLALGQAGNAPASYRAALNACIEQQFAAGDSPQLNKKIELAQDCPDLSAALAERDSENFIVPVLEDTTSLNQLLDERYLQARPYTPRQAPLTDLNMVKQLAMAYDFKSPVNEGPDWWERFRQWLKEKYGSDTQETNIDWLLELLDGFSIPEWLGDSIYFGSIALIILLAVIIIVNELRYYKRFKNRDSATGVIDHVDPVHALRNLSWAEVQGLPLNEKAGALLQYLIQQSINRGWLPDNKSFTNREFCRALQTVDPAKAAQFSQVINSAEQDVYGQQPVSRSEIDELFQISQLILQDSKVPAS